MCFLFRRLRFHFSSLSNTHRLFPVKLNSPPPPNSLSDPDYKTRCYAPYTVTASYIILATGSHPRHPPGIPIDEKLIATSDGIHTNWTRWPESVVIVGAGVIGCEFATVLGLSGVTKVNLIANRERILWVSLTVYGKRSTLTVFETHRPFEDEDVARVIERNMINRGVTIHRNAKLENMCIEAGQRVKCGFGRGDGSGRRRPS